MVAELSLQEELPQPRGRHRHQYGQMVSRQVLVLRFFLLNQIANHHVRAFQINISGNRGGVTHEAIPSMFPQVQADIASSETSVRVHA
jgi:hypothetical protein